MLRHLHGEQWVADEILNRLFLFLADQTKQGAMVDSSGEA
jgi:hypothetical protein